MAYSGYAGLNGEMRIGLSKSKEYLTDFSTAKILSFCGNRFVKPIAFF